MTVLLLQEVLVVSSLKHEVVVVVVSSMWKAHVKSKVSSKRAVAGAHEV
jgi:hypothetical protein